MSPAQDLEQVWRIRTECAKQRYDECAQGLEHLAAEVLRDQSAVNDEAMLQARMRESVALHEYRRTLQIYTELILHGTVRDEAEILRGRWPKAACELE